MMRKLFVLTILVFSFSILSLAQSKSNSAIEREIKTLRFQNAITLSFDEADSMSKILAIAEDFGKEQDIKVGLDAFYFGFAFFYSGKTLTTAPDLINLTFTAQTKNPKFGESHNVVIVSGKDSVDLGEARYVSKPDRKMEYLNFKIKRDDLIKIAKFYDAKLQIGNISFTFSPEHMRLFKAMVQISDPLSDMKSVT